MVEVNAKKATHRILNLVDWATITASLTEKVKNETFVFSVPTKRFAPIWIGANLFSLWNLS